MAKPLLSNLHVHVTDVLEKCWTCEQITPGAYHVGGGVITLRDPDVGIVSCPKCKGKKIL